jgi:hypothetical protein
MVPGTTPLHARPYRLSDQKKEVDTQVSELLQDRIITESKSPWNSPLVIVPKKEDACGDKKWWLVVDFRKLNDKSVG